jgi:hypothetical protein
MFLLEVLEMGSGGRALVRAGGQVFAARCQTTIPLGGPIRVEVASVRPEILLRVAPEAQGPLESLRRSIWRAIPLLDGDGPWRLWDEALGEWRAWGMAEEAPSPHLLRGHMFPGPGMLAHPRTWLAASGLLLEAKLGRLARGALGPGELAPDLKGWLLRVLQAAEKKGESLPATGDLLEILEGGQSLALLSQKGGAAPQIPLLLWGPLPQDRGEARIRKGSPGVAGGEGRWEVTVRLELAALGRIVIHLGLGEDCLECSLRASEPSTERLLQAGIQTLREGLLALGLGRVQCRCGPMEPGDGREGPWGALPDGLLDTRA